MIRYGKSAGSKIHNSLKVITTRRANEIDRHGYFRVFGKGKYQSTPTPNGESPGPLNRVNPTSVAGRRIAPNQIEPKGEEQVRIRAEDLPGHPFSD